METPMSHTMNIAVLGTDPSWGIPVVRAIVLLFAHTVRTNPRLSNLTLPEDFRVEVHSVIEESWISGQGPDRSSMAHDVIAGWMTEHWMVPNISSELLWPPPQEEHQLCIEEAGHTYQEALQVVDGFDPKPYHLVLGVGLDRLDLLPGDVAGVVETMMESDDIQYLAESGYQDKVALLQELAELVFKACTTYLRAGGPLLTSGTPPTGETPLMSRDLLQQMDLGLEVDVKVFDRALRFALLDLFAGREMTDWNMWLLGCLMQGMCSNMGEVATMWSMVPREEIERVMMGLERDEEDGDG